MLNYTEAKSLAAEIINGLEDLPYSEMWLEMYHWREIRIMELTQLLEGRPAISPDKLEDYIVAVKQLIYDSLPREGDNIGGAATNAISEPPMQFRLSAIHASSLSSSSANFIQVTDNLTKLTDHQDGLMAQIYFNEEIDVAHDFIPKIQAVYLRDIIQVMEVRPVGIDFRRGIPNYFDDFWKLDSGIHSTDERVKLEDAELDIEKAIEEVKLIKQGKKEDYDIFYLAIFIDLYDIVRWKIPVQNMCKRISRFLKSLVGLVICSKVSSGPAFSKSGMGVKVSIFRRRSNFNKKDISDLIKETSRINKLVKAIEMYGELSEAEDRPNIARTISNYKQDLIDKLNMESVNIERLEKSSISFPNIVLKTIVPEVLPDVIVSGLNEIRDANIHVSPINAAILQTVPLDGVESADIEYPRDDRVLPESDEQMGLSDDEQAIITPGQVNDETIEQRRITNAWRQTDTAPMWRVRLNYTGMMRGGITINDVVRALESGGAEILNVIDNPFESPYIICTSGFIKESNKIDSDLPTVMEVIDRNMHMENSVESNGPYVMAYNMFIFDQLEQMIPDILDNIFNYTSIDHLISDTLDRLRAISAEDALFIRSIELNFERHAVVPPRNFTRVQIPDTIEWPYLTDGQREYIERIVQEDIDRYNYANSEEYFQHLEEVISRAQNVSVPSLDEKGVVDILRDAVKEYLSADHRSIIVQAVDDSSPDRILGIGYRPYNENIKEEPNLVPVQPDLSVEFITASKVGVKTVGINWPEIMKMRDVDKVSSMALSVHDVHRHYGIDSVSAYIRMRLPQVYDEMSGFEVAERHIGVAAAFITAGPKLRKLTYSLVNEKSDGAFSRLIEWKVAAGITTNIMTTYTEMNPHMTTTFTGTIPPIGSAFGFNRDELAALESYRISGYGIPDNYFDRKTTSTVDETYILEQYVESRENIDETQVDLAQQVRNLLNVSEDYFNSIDFEPDERETF
jgi:hypothetical protein